MRSSCPKASFFTFIFPSPGNLACQGNGGDTACIGQHAASWRPGAWARICRLGAGHSLLTELGSKPAVGREGVSGLSSHGSQFPLQLFCDQRSRYSSVSRVRVRKIPGGMAPMVMAQGAHSSLKPVSLLPPTSLASLHCCSLPTCLVTPASSSFFVFPSMQCFPSLLPLLILTPKDREPALPASGRLPKLSQPNVPSSPYASWVESQQPPAPHLHVM